MNKPRPVPPRLALFGACSKGAKIVSATASGTPGPVSITLRAISTRPSLVSCVESFAVTLPASVNLMAF
jgi:hypothetical protein